MVGRPERALDPDGSPLTELALALRELRRSAGSPSYRVMAKQVHRSPTALSEAAGGTQVPSWDTVEAYVRACEADPSEWRARWEAVRDSRTPDTPHKAADEDDRIPTPEALAPTQPIRRSNWLTRRTGLITLGVGLVLAILPVGYFTLLRPTPASPTAITSVTPSATQAVHDGADPKDSGCALDPDLITLDGAEVDYDGKPAGLAQLRYAPTCGVAWARFEPFPNAAIPTGAMIHTDTIRPADDNLRMPFQAPYVGAPVYGNLLVSTSNCVLAAAWIEANGQSLPESRTHCFRGKTAVES